MKIKTILLSMSALLLLGGCGSGGEGSTSHTGGLSTTTEPQPVEFEFDEKQYVSSVVTNYIFSYSKETKKISGDYYQDLYKLTQKEKSEQNSFVEAPKFVYLPTVASVSVYQKSVMSIDRGEVNYLFFYTATDQGEKGVPCFALDTKSGYQFANLVEYEGSGLEAFSHMEMPGQYKSTQEVNVKNRNGVSLSRYVMIEMSTSIGILSYSQEESFTHRDQIYTISLSKLSPNVIRGNVGGMTLAEFNITTNSFKFSLVAQGQEKAECETVELFLVGK